MRGETNNPNITLWQDHTNNDLFHRGMDSGFYSDSLEVNPKTNVLEFNVGGRVLGGTIRQIHKTLSNSQEQESCGVVDHIGHMKMQIAKLTAERDEAWAIADRLYDDLDELFAQVKGECPSLLDEDMGGDAELYLSIKSNLEAYRKSKGKTKDLK